MTGTVWPKWKGGPTLEEYAKRQLSYESRFDEPLDRERRNLENAEFVELDTDWAVRAARGIINEFGDRGAAFNDAFHPEKIDQETRAEIVEVMAAIMREALKHNESQGRI